MAREAREEGALRSWFDILVVIANPRLPMVRAYHNSFGVTLAENIRLLKLHWNRSTLATLSDIAAVTFLDWLRSAPNAIGEASRTSPEKCHLNAQGRKHQIERVDILNRGAAVV